MKKNFTKAFILSHRGCFEREQIVGLMQGFDPVTLDQVLGAEFPFNDKAHFIITKGDLTDRQKQILNINIAEVVLPLFEKEYPKNDYARNAIKSAKAYLENKITLAELKALDIDLHHANVPDLDMNIETKYGEGINERAAAIFALSSACSAYNCAVDPKQYQGDSVYDAYLGAKKTMLPYEEKVQNTFVKIVGEIFAKDE